MKPSQKIRILAQLVKEAAARQQQAKLYKTAAITTALAGLEFLRRKVFGHV